MYRALILHSAYKEFSFGTTELLCYQSDIFLRKKKLLTFPHSYVTESFYHLEVFAADTDHKLEHRIQSYSKSCLIESTISAF